MIIRLTADVPFRCPPRRLSHMEKIEVQKTDDGLVREGVIPPSGSPYDSAAVLVNKTAYFSKLTTAAESRYHRFEVETLAISYALHTAEISSLLREHTL